MLTKQQVLEKPNTLTFKIPQGMRAGQALFNMLKDNGLLEWAGNERLPSTYFENFYEKDTAEIQELYNQWLNKLK